MEAREAGEIVVEALQLAEARLRGGEDLAPLVVVERWAEFDVESFDQGALSEAEARFNDLIAHGPGNETYAWVHLERVDSGETVIVIKRGLPGRPEPEAFIQRFRSRRGPLRRFKRIGELKPVSAGEATAQSSAP